MTEIKFKDRVPVPASITIGVAGDNNSQEIVFSFDKTLSGNIFLKLEQEDYIDKIPLIYNDNKAMWRVTQSVLSHTGRILAQIQMEDTCDIVWQTYQFSLISYGSIIADELIEEYYPSVLRDLGQRVTQIEKYGISAGNGAPVNQGEQGAIVEKGDKGDTGEQGPMGEKGDKGDTGEQGPAGEKGDKGDTGEQGPMGEKGDKGDTGEQGPMGEKGDKGDTGEQGPAGEKGDKGDTGEQGPAGEKGDKGDTGEQGQMGEKGDKGDTGEQGPMGEKGDKGDPGDVNCYTRTESDEKFATAFSGNAHVFTIPVSLWKSSASYPEYPFEANLQIDGITNLDLIRADFDMPSWMIAMEAEVCATGTGSAGIVTFFAKTAPDSVIGGMYTINKTMG